jgi:hypothetical protein
MLNVRIRWKSNATAKDMGDVVRGCRMAGYRLRPGGPSHGWFVFTKPLEEVEND